MQVSDIPRANSAPKGADDPPESHRPGALAWDDDGDNPPPTPLTATEAQAFRHQRNAPSPWKVVVTQAEAGAAIAFVVGLFTGWSGALSALFGVATAVVPGALMARGVSRMADIRSPLASAIGMLGWESAKIICSVGMLVMASRVLHPVVWPALLVGLAGCLAVYWAALAWRSH